MADFKITGIELKGVAAAVPSRTEHNTSYSKLSDSEIKLLIKTTGVQSRRVAPKGLATSDLCMAAAEKLIVEAGWRKQDIDLLIFISQSRDYYLPSTSAVLQEKMGLAKSCLSFDVGLGCSGFVYGLSIASSMMKGAGLKKALVLAGDVSSATCSYDDKSTYPLFGDAGTAVLLENTGSENISYFDMNTDGSGFEAIMIQDGGIRNLVSEDSFKKVKYAEGIERSRLNVALNGLEVFNFSITTVPRSVENFKKKYSFTSSDIDYFIMHQANLLMNESIRKKTGFSEEQVPYCLNDYGNTSSASIPLTLVTRLRTELSSRKLELLMSGFGVGLSWGNAKLQTNSIACPELIEL